MRRTPLLAFKLRLTDCQSGADDSHGRAALPDPAGSHPPQIHAGRSGAAARSVWRAQPLGPDSAKSFVDACQSGRAFVQGNDAGRSSGAVHFRFQRGRDQIFRRTGGRRSSGLPAVQRHRFLCRSGRRLAGRAHLLGQGGPLQAAGKNLARNDGVLLSQQRLAVPAQRRLRPPVPIQSRSMAFPPGKRRWNASFPVEETVI